MAWYLDTSAFLKLLIAEPETSAMRRWFADQGPHWSSQLLRTEAMRASTRLQLAESVVDGALGMVTLVLLAAPTFLVAGRLAPTPLRSIDALHLATALELAPDVQGIVTYDVRLAEGASAAGIDVVAPGK